MCHTHIYSIGPTPKSFEYYLFGQFLKFLELLRQFLPDMSDLWTGHIRLARHVWLAGYVRLRARTCLSIGFPAYIRGMSAPPLLL
jgi:hypothetical protein